MASNFYKAGAAAMTSNKDDWETPQSLFDQLDEEFHFTLDAASNDQNAKCEHHYTAENSGLEHSWEGETVFCNPPYGRNIGDWIRKASQEASKPDTLVVLLVPARTDTRWFQNHILHRAEVRFLPGRLKYEVIDILPRLKAGEDVNPQHDRGHENRRTLVDALHRRPGEHIRLQLAV